MSIELIDKIKPKNNGAFALVDAHDVEMPDGTRLDTWEGGGDIPTFDLVALGLPSVPLDGTQVGAQMDTAQITAALDKGPAKFSMVLSIDGEETPFDAVMNPTRATVGEGIVSYMCSHALAIMNGELLNLIFMSGGCYAVILPIGGATASNPATSINLSGLDTTGQIVETYADGSTKTTSLEFDADGNPIKITDGDGNVTTLIW